MKSVVQHLPVTFTILLVGTVIVSFVLGFSLHHFETLTPTVSLLGNRFPESGIFSLGIFAATINWLIVAVLIYVYHEKLIAVSRLQSALSSTKQENTFVNKLHLFFGFLVAVGFGGVASFRSNEDATLNYIFVGISCVSCWIYMIMGTILSHTLISASMGSISLSDYRSRLALSTVGTMASFGASLTIGYWLSSKEEIMWTLFAIFEHVFLLSFATFSATYLPNLRYYKLDLSLVSIYSAALLGSVESGITVPLMKPINSPVANYNTMFNHQPVHL